MEFADAWTESCRCELRIMPAEVPKSLGADPAELGAVLCGNTESSELESSLHTTKFSSGASILGEKPGSKVARISKSSSRRV